MKEQKEQKPPMTLAEIQRVKRDPDKFYKYVGTDKDNKGEGRIEHYKDKGYEVVAMGQRVALMACKNSLVEQRQREQSERFERAKKAAAQMQSDDSVSASASTLTTEFEVNPNKD